MATNIQLNILTASNIYETLYPQTDYNLLLNKPTIPTVPSLPLSVTNGGTGVTSYSALASQLNNYLGRGYEISMVSYYTVTYGKVITFPTISGKTPKYYYFSSVIRTGPTNSYITGTGLKNIPQNKYIQLENLFSLYLTEGEYLCDSPFIILRLWEENGTVWKVDGSSYTVTKGVVELDKTITGFEITNNGYTLNPYVELGSVDSNYPAIAMAFCA